MKLLGGCNYCILTNNIKEPIQKLIISSACLLLGLLLYILFGNKIFGMDMKILEVNTIFTKLFRNYFFDFIWAFSFYIMSSYIIKLLLKNYKLSTGLYVIIIGIVYELLQLFGVVKGTFDIFDIVIYITAVAISSIIEKKIWSDSNGKNK